MYISNTAVEQRITVCVLTVLIVLAGAYCYATMPREAAPEVVIPHVFVNTNYEGVSPEDMETSVTRQIEDKLRGIDGVKKIKSVSDEGNSSIDVEFITGVDIDVALQKVKDKIDEAKRDLPNDLKDDPIADDVNFSEMPILTFSLSGSAGLKTLRDIADNLQDLIEGVPGVLEVQISGGLEREIQIEIIPEKMTLYAVSPIEVQNIVAAENSNVSGGSIRMNDGRYRLRVEGEFKTVTDAENIVVATRNGQPIYLRDIATIRDGFKDQESLSRLDGEDAVKLEVKKRSGENIIEVADRVQATIEKDKPNWPAGTRITLLENKADEIFDMLQDLENNIISGFLLVLVVVMVAMGFRNAMLVSISIPLSMLLGFIVLKAIGVSLNMVVLFSLTLALGMLVDNAIVIIENIYRFMQEGVPCREATKAATSEVAYPIIGSALTTIAAFTPLLWWDGVMGEFMKYLPLTVIILLSCCLFVALVINPALASYLMKAKPVGEPISAEEIMKRGEHPMLNEGGVLVQLYRRILGAAIGLRMKQNVSDKLPEESLLGVVAPLIPRLAIIGISGLTLVFFMVFWFWRVGVKTPAEFFPTIDPKQVNVNFTMPEGADLDYCDNIIVEVERRLANANYPADETTRAQSVQDLMRGYEHKNVHGEIYTGPSDLRNVTSISSKAQISANAGEFFGGNAKNNISVHMQDYEKRDPNYSTFKTQEEMLKRIVGIPGAKMTVEFDKEGPPTGSAITVEIRGADFDVLGRLADQVERFVRQVPFTRNIRNDFEQGSPTIKIDVNRQRAALLGLSTKAVGSALRTAFNGTDISDYRADEDDYDIVVRFRDSDRHTIDMLHRLFIPTATGLVPLTSIATINYTGGMGRITRIDHNRVVSVKADVDSENTTGDTARKQLEALLTGSPLFSTQTLFQKDQSLEAFQAAIKNPGVAALFDDPDLKPWLAHFSTVSTHVQLVAVLNDFIQSAKVEPEHHREALLAALDASAKEHPYSGDEMIRARAMLQIPDNAPDAQRQKMRRLMLELCAPGVFMQASAGLDLPTGYSYVFTGEQEEQDKSAAFLKWAMAVAVALIFLVLVAQFNSTTYPFIIMMSVVLSLAGVFFGLGVCNMPFGIVMTGVGVISLAGVVVNNAIVLLDYTLQLMKRGLSRDEAIIAAGCTRLRPVLLTAITTVLGLIPMATGWSYDFHTFSVQTASESSLWWKGMAVAVIFGLTVATMLTLIVVPVLFSLLSGISESTWLFFDILKRKYWQLFWHITGLSPRPDEAGYPKAVHHHTPPKV